MALDAGNKIVNTNTGTVVDGKDVGGGFFVTETLASIPSYANVQGALCYNKDDGKFYQRGVSTWEEADLGGGGTEDYASVSNFPATGEAGVIYVAKDTNNIYRYDTSNSEYVELSPYVAEADVEVITHQTTTALTDAQWDKAKKGKLIVKDNMGFQYVLGSINNSGNLYFYSKIHLSSSSPATFPRNVSVTYYYFYISYSTKMMSNTIADGVNAIQYHTSGNFFDAYSAPSSNEAKIVLGKNLARTQGMIYATEYSASTIYKIGDLVTRENNLYECNTDMSASESWTSAHWTQTTLGDYVKKWGYGIITIKISSSGTLDSALLAQVLANPHNYRFYNDTYGYFETCDPGTTGASGTYLTYYVPMVSPAETLNITRVYRLQINKTTGEYAPVVSALFDQNPTILVGEAVTPLTSLKIGNYLYSIPYTEVEGNPTVPSGTTPTSLTGLKIGANYYSISGGSGGGTSYTAGDGISISNGEISVDGDRFLKTCTVQTCDGGEYQDLIAAMTGQSDVYPNTEDDIFFDADSTMKTMLTAALQNSYASLAGKIDPSTLKYTLKKGGSNNEFGQALGSSYILYFNFLESSPSYLILDKGLILTTLESTDLGKKKYIFIANIYVLQHALETTFILPTGYTTSDFMMFLVKEKEEFEPVYIDVSGGLTTPQNANNQYTYFHLGLLYKVEKEADLQAFLDAATNALSTTVTKDNFNTIVSGLWQQTASDPTMRYLMLYKLMFGMKTLGIDPVVSLMWNLDINPDTYNDAIASCGSLVTVVGDDRNVVAGATIIAFLESGNPFYINPLDPTQLASSFTITLSDIDPFTSNNNN